VATILVKGIPEDLLKELKRLKVEMNCRTWAELFRKLAESKEQITFSKEELQKMRHGTDAFLKLSRSVSSKWSGPPSVVGEFRKSRAHEGD
jgi:hypothetical protein